MQWSPRAAVNQENSTSGTRSCLVPFVVVVRYTVTQCSRKSALPLLLFEIVCYCVNLTNMAVAQAICCPTDVVKIRMQGDASGARYNKGIASAFQSIARNEGIRGMYQGVVPASQRAAVVAAVELSTYDSFKVGSWPIPRKYPSILLVA